MPPAHRVTEGALPMESARIQPQAPPPAENASPSTWKPADPGPLGLGAFAMTTFVLSMFNSNLVDPKGLPVVLGLALAYGGRRPLHSRIWEVRTRNTLGARALCPFGGV